MKPIDLAGFEDTFGGSDDPWRTLSDHDEALKRDAILHGIGAAPIGRVLELGAGNGSNSAAIARRALRLDATEGTRAGTDLIGKAIGQERRARAIQLALPARFPQPVYDVAVVAELLYYLSAFDMDRVARDVAAVLRPGGRLVLAHHRIDFHDFTQHAHGIHDRFLRATNRRWRPLYGRRTGRWRVESYQA